MTQDQALSILKTGANVFLTGEPGSGKTYVINKYIAWLDACKVKVAVTASTGIAATHIGGSTIHSWSGVGARDTLKISTPAAGTYYLKFFSGSSFVKTDTVLVN